MSPGTDNGDEDDETVKDDETVRQVRLSIYQPFTDEETGHGTIPLLSEGVAAGQGSTIKTSEFLVQKDHHQRYRKQRVMGTLRIHSFVAVCPRGLSCSVFPCSCGIEVPFCRSRHHFFGKAVVFGKECYF